MWRLPLTHYFPLLADTSMMLDCSSKCRSPCAGDTALCAVYCTGKNYSWTGRHVSLTHLQPLAGSGPHPAAWLRLSWHWGAWAALAEHMEIEK